MKITAQQEKFAQAVADGMTQADAYRSAYATKGTPQAVAEKASRLMANSKIAARVAGLRVALENSALWSREESVAQLAEVARGGKALERVAAVKELNSMHGFNAPVKQEIKHLLPRTIKLVALRG